MRQVRAFAYEAARGDVLDVPGGNDGEQWTPFFIERSERIEDSVRYREVRVWCWRDQPVKSPIHPTGVALY